MSNPDENSSFKWFHYALFGAGALGVISVVGLLFGTPSEAQQRQKRRAIAVDTEDQDVEDPQLEKKIMMAHKRALDARNGRAGNWADVAGTATADAIKLMEKSPKYRNSLQMAEIHFIRFEVYSSQGEAFAPMAEYHLESARKCLENTPPNPQFAAAQKQMLSLVYSNLSEFYNQLNQYAKAEPYGEKAVKLFETEIFKNDPMNINVAITKTSLAMCKSSLKKHREAEELFKSALAIFKKSSMDAQEIAPIQCVTRLGNVLLAQGKHEEAEKLLVPYYQQLVKVGAHQRALGIIYCLARLYYDESRFAEARPLLERALELSLGSTLEPIIRTSYLSLLWEMGDVESALAQSVEVRRAKFVAFAESRSMITRDCSLDGTTRKYSIEIENKISIDHHLNGNRKLPEGTTLVVSFEHPDADEKTVMIEHVVARGESLVKLESPVISGDAETAPFAADKFYEIVIRAYSDPEKENLIGTHHQLMVESSSAQRSARG